VVFFFSEIWFGREETCVTELEERTTISQFWEKGLSSRNTTVLEKTRFYKTAVYNVAKHLKIMEFLKTVVSLKYLKNTTKCTLKLNVADN
jgi:hypothetical protein